MLRARGERYVVVNPLATFRVREARQLSREKTDLTDAEQIAELCRTGLVTRTQLEARPYLALRRAWGEYARLREERARLKVLVAHQLYGLFPEFLRVWADLLQPGALAVLRTGLTPAAMAALSLTEFVAQVRATAPATGSGATNWPRSTVMPSRRLPAPTDSMSSRAKCNGRWRGWICSPPT